MMTRLMQAAMLAGLLGLYGVTSLVAQPAAQLQRSAVSLVPDPTWVAPYGSTPLGSDVFRPQILVGPRFGLNRNYHGGGFRTFGGPECPTFHSGLGPGVLGGLTVAYRFGRANSVVGALAFENRPGAFAETLPDVDVLVQDAPTTQTVTMKSEIAYRLATAELMYVQDIPLPFAKPRLSLAAGPSVGYVVGGTLRQVMDLEKPENARLLPQPGATLAEGGRQLVFADGSRIPGLNQVRFSMKLGAQFEVGLFGNDIMFYPGVFYDIGLTDVTSTESWGLNSMMVQFDLRRAF